MFFARTETRMKVDLVIISRAKCGSSFSKKDSRASSVPGKRGVGRWQQPGEGATRARLARVLDWILQSDLRPFKGIQRKNNFT